MPHFMHQRTDIRIIQARPGSLLSQAYDSPTEIIEAQFEIVLSAPLSLAEESGKFLHFFLYIWI